MRIRWEYVIQTGIQLGISLCIVVSFIWLFNTVIRSEGTSLEERCAEKMSYILAYQQCKGDDACVLDFYDHKKAEQKKWEYETECTGVVIDPRFVVEIP